MGIEDIHVPEWGDAPLTLEGKHLSEEDKDMVPVFWGCGVTPQEAVMKAKLPGVVLGHAPGHMIVVDVREWEVLEEKNPN